MFLNFLWWLWQENRCEAAGEEPAEETVGRKSLASCSTCCTAWRPAASSNVRQRPHRREQLCYLPTVEIRC